MLDVLASRILLTIAIEHVANAKGSPTRFAILNLLLLRMLRLLPATSIFRGYVSMVRCMLREAFWNNVYVVEL